MAGRAPVTKAYRDNCSSVTLNLALLHCSIDPDLRLSALSQFHQIDFIPSRHSGYPLNETISQTIWLYSGPTILNGLWSGKPFSYKGLHYQLDQAQFLPTPVQVPRIPIWVAGVWPHKRPFRRAAQWDGVCPIGRDHIPTPNDIAEMLGYIRQHRQADLPFDVVLGAYERDSSEMSAQLADYAGAGVTWWLECFDWEDSLADVQARIRGGPPR